VYRVQNANFNIVSHVRQIIYPDTAEIASFGYLELFKHQLSDKQFFGNVTFHKWNMKSFYSISDRVESLNIQRICESA